MRLKLLFFPMIIVISLVIIFTKIRPNFLEISSTKKDLAQNEQSLNGYLEKSGTMQSLHSSLAANDAQVKWLKSYLPEKRLEESVIYKINSVAVSSGVALLKLEIRKEEEKVSGDDEDAGTMLVSGNLQNAANAIAEKNKPQNIEKKQEMQKILVSIGVNGDYNSLRIFLDRLRKLDSNNSVNSVNIERILKKTDEGEVDDGRLSLDAEIAFGYMPALVNASVNEKILTQKEFDFKVISDTQLAGIDVPEMTMVVEGRENPFTPAN